MRTRFVRRNGAGASQAVHADICVVGAGISGVSAALEAAALGREVVLVDGLPALGGQAVNSIIGTFCGLFSNGTHGYQFTHGVADRILHDLDAEGALFFRHGPTTTVVYYNEVALARWVEKAVLDAGITPIVGAILNGVRRDGRRIEALKLVTRYGEVTIEASGFVDATGDAALTWQAGLECQEPESPIYGSQMVVIEGIDEKHQPTRDELAKRVGEKGADYGLIRKDGIAFYFPGRGTAVLNITHVETPLDPLAATRKGIEGKDQADRAVAFVRGEFPKAFSDIRVRAYGFPGVRQTRWIKGRRQMTADEVRAGFRYDDAIARTAWPIELHDKPTGYQWEPFGADHVHYVPFSAMTPPGVDNLVATGRCIDGDPAALSSVRVMGPCIAMGAAAAHALDLAGAGSVHQIDIAALQTRLSDNLERTDRTPHRGESG
jgi:2-polyprenyl-6-methoxyphenol hydroxylase-like FAD-dependent oxidoreductase